MNEPNKDSKACLPPLEEKDKALQIVEGYITQADLARDKVQKSLASLKELLDNANAQREQREKELLVLNGQKELLLNLQKQIVSQPK